MEKSIAYTTASTAAYWMACQVQPSGKFLYGYDVKKKVKVRGYNMLRHAGAIWAMLDMYKEEMNITIAESSKRALDWMIKKHIQKWANRKILIENGYAKVGGAGLAALALIRYYKLFGNKKYKNNAVDLCRYIQYCCTNGELHTLKRKISDNTDTGFICDFYQGEAALALCKVNEVMPNDDFLFEAKKIIAYYWTLREDEGHIRDHWMLQAMEFFGTEFKHYAQRIAYCTMNDPISFPELAGPMACRVEAALAYRNILKQLGKDISNIDSYIDQMLERTNICQIQIGENVGAFYKHKTSNEVRIDYAQHNICAALRYYREI